MKYYKFSTEEIAEGAKQAICDIGGCPQIHGDPNGEHGTTECWDNVVSFVGGGYGFQRLPEYFREQYSDQEAYFDATFPHEIVEITSIETEIE